MSAYQTREFLKIIDSIPGGRRVKGQFRRRIREGRLTRDENPLTHLTVYFAGYDPRAREIFIGHHIKSGRWLFTGGHIDQGELPHEALVREIGEEWGKGFEAKAEIKPSLLTITDVQYRQVKPRPCRFHYDIWHFIPVNKQSFKPDKHLLATEFHEIGWKNYREVKKLVTDPSTITAIAAIETL